MRIVLANGCFDIFHAGHARHLAEARALGEELWVSLTLDEHVNKGPGRPVHSWEDRAEVLRGCRYVDRVLPSEHGAQAVRKYRPTIFVKGIDYRDGISQCVIDACAEVGAKLVYTSSEKMSSTDILRRMKCGS